MDKGNRNTVWGGTSNESGYNSVTKTYTVTNGQELTWVSDGVQSGSLIFAAYTDDDILVTAESKNIDALTPDTLLSCDFNLPYVTSRYKIFVRNSGMIPLSKSAEIK